MKKFILSVGCLVALSACGSGTATQEPVNEEAAEQVEEQPAEQAEEQEEAADESAENEAEEPAEAPVEEEEEAKQETEEEQQEPIEDATPLTAEEAVQFTIAAEKEAVEILSNSFEIGEEEVSFTDSFETIANNLSHLYSNGYIDSRIRAIYENPGRFYETISAFPLAQDTVPPNHVIIHSDEEVDVYVQPMKNGEDNFIYQYSLAVEDNKWKIIDVKEYLSTKGAEKAVRHVTKISGEDTFIEFDGSADFADQVKLLLEGEKYLIQYYVTNDHGKITLGWYTVDPVTRTVYELDLLTNEYTEIGSF